MIYLDYNATAPLRPPVRAALLEAFDLYGNASSPYDAGRRARAAIESARRDIAEVIGVAPRQVCFTSGGTESNNTAVFGAFDAGGDEIVCAAHDHSSVVAAAAEVGRCGGSVAFLPSDRQGRIDVEGAAAVIGERTKLVSLCWANNEIGTVQDTAALAALCRQRGVVFHLDAVQGLAKIGTDLPAADLISITAHKLGGPKGIGALIAGRDVAVRPLLFGGSQERGVRPGTENVAGACGFAAAVIAAASDGEWSSEVRERLWCQLAAIAGVHRFSPQEGCLPNTLLVGFDGIRGESIVAALDLEGVAVSVGSACAAGSGEASHVLLALGYGDEQARGGVRFSSGRATTAAEIDEAAAKVVAVVERIRAAQSPLPPEQPGQGAGA